MTLASRAGSLISHYRGSVAGYDETNARLIDLSGNGYHLPKLAGAVAYGTYSGRQAMRLRGDAYFGCPVMDTVPVYPFPTRYTQIAVVWVDLVGTDNYSFVWGMLRDTAANDPAWKNPTTAVEASSQQGYGLRLLATGNAYGLSGGTPFHNVGSNFTPGAWNVIQFAVDPDASQYRLRVGTGPWTAFAIPVHYSLVAMDDFRLGYKPTPIETTGGKDFALGQLITLTGDPANENSEGYNALIAALVANPLA